MEFKMWNLKAEYMIYWACLFGGIFLILVIFLLGYLTGKVQNNKVVLMHDCTERLPIKKQGK